MGLDPWQLPGLDPWQLPPLLTSYATIQGVACSSCLGGVAAYMLRGKSPAWLCCKHLLPISGWPLSPFLCADLSCLSAFHVVAAWIT